MILVDLTPNKVSADLNMSFYTGLYKDEIFDQDIVLNDNEYYVFKFYRNPMIITHYISDLVDFLLKNVYNGFKELLEHVEFQVPIELKTMDYLETHEYLFEGIKVTYYE